MTQTQKTVYFAHPIQTYGTKFEYEQLDVLHKFFAHVINPSEYASHAMDFYYQLVSDVDVLFFAGNTRGVLCEISLANLLRKNVYTKISGKITQVIFSPIDCQMISQKDKKEVYRFATRKKLNKIFIPSKNNFSYKNGPHKK